MSPTQYDADKMYTSKEHAMRSCREINNTGKTAVGKKLYKSVPFHSYCACTGIILGCVAGVVILLIIVFTLTFIALQYIPQIC